ncbi:hypothetical protein, variant 6 [Aphanomyces invadans]|uniref:Polycystin domain-containing protein n=1 Tax=Aphanomyces invadans TaxID=157072 RepID=A0A024TF13_9STRA|nr:hypothetical protein, variant 5 [Aphanomyces invadans]XP_008879148.1 hypothetical protein, variant 6 [Aphanomyces invadans]ETV92186.1 hypothetical protein, variant 5 [Aphanomyces invadans]ETV92187.1 hypothetical protein, variant 6 [Aphanomyces invadans]|eukprot:XP_008879147.1 hypothetical protein, variant 5 [Aphanomyces invadans]
MRSEEEELLEPLVDPSPPSPQMGKDRSGNPLAHGVHLSPWERYWHHGRIPWKVILHALLMFCGTLQIMLYDNQNSAYVRASYRNWAYFFLPNGGMSTSTRSMDATPLEESIFTVNDTLNAVAHVRDAYFSIKDVSVATYEYHYAAPTIVQPMLMSVTQYKNKTIGPPQHYNITPTSLGPFDDLDTTETAMVFLHSLVTIEFSFPLRDIDYGPFYVDCFDWTVRLTLAMHENSHFRLRVDECSLDVCSVKNVWATLRGRFVWMNVLVAVFAGIYLVVILRSVVRAVKRLARRPKHDPVPATLRDLNGHYCLIGATLVLVEFNALWNISSVVVHVPLRFDHRFIQALGPLLLWSTFVGYLEHNPRFYSIVLTLRASVPKVVGFLVRTRGVPSRRVKVATRWGCRPSFLGTLCLGRSCLGTAWTALAGFRKRASRCSRFSMATSSWTHLHRCTPTFRSWAPRICTRSLRSSSTSC